MSGWTSVTKCLPTDGLNVLCYWGSPEIAMSVCSYDSERNCWLDAWTLDEQNGDVTHWMPLPPLPGRADEHR